MKVKVGDRVRFLNATGGGIVRTVLRSSGVVYVEDESGFELPVMANEVVVVEEGATIVPKPQPHSAPQPPKGGAVERKPPLGVAVERKPPLGGLGASGEELNASLCYLVEEGGQLGQGHYEVYLVNESNYDLFVVYTSGKSAAQELRFAGVVPFDSSLLLETFAPDELPDRYRTTIQLLAYKEEGGPYRPKPAMSIELKVVGARFFKQNAFVENPFFDDPAIVMELVRSDQPMTANKIDALKLAAQMMGEKIMQDQQPAKPTRPQPKRSKEEPIVVDLHIEELVDTTRGMESRHMLELQLKKVDEVMKSLRKPQHVGTKVIFIHGKGEGVLRNAVTNHIQRFYPRATMQDASFQEYGFGATQVTIR